MGMVSPATGTGAQGAGVPRIRQRVSHPGTRPATTPGGEEQRAACGGRVDTPGNLLQLLDRLQAAALEPW